MGTFSLVHGVGWALGPFIGTSLLYPHFQGHPLILWGLLGLGGAAAAAGFAAMTRRWETT